MDETYLNGRGSQIAIKNKFERNHVVFDDHYTHEQKQDGVKTQLIYDHSKKIVNKVNSPDLGFNYSVNPYQGCEHGCIYCYARNSHQYWGFDSGLDFESKIVVKENAALLLEEFLLKKKEAVPIALSGNTDCYQPIERKLKITRQLLEVFAKYRNPVSIITKNSLILRDLDILKDLAKDNLVHVSLSITTLDEQLRRVMEPRTSSAAKKFDTMNSLAKHGISVGVMTAPIIPGLNHHEIPQLLKRASESGANTAAYTVVRLNGDLENIFGDWLNRNFPMRYEKVMNQIKELHNGKVSDSEWGRRMKGDGEYALTIRKLFYASFKRYFGDKKRIQLNREVFRKGGNYQLF